LQAGRIGARSAGAAGITASPETADMGVMVANLADGPFSADDKFAEADRAVELVSSLLKTSSACAEVGSPAPKGVFEFDW